MPNNDKQNFSLFPSHRSAFLLGWLSLWISKMIISSPRLGNASRKRFYFYIILLALIGQTYVMCPSLNQPQWSNACNMVKPTLTGASLRSQRQFEKHSFPKKKWVTNIKMGMGTIIGIVGNLSKIHFPLLFC